MIISPYKERYQDHGFGCQKQEETGANGADAAHILSGLQTGAAQPQWQGTQNTHNLNFLSTMSE